MGGECKYDHDHVDIRKIKGQGLLARKLSRSYEYSTGRQAEKVLKVSLRGEEYRSCDGNAYQSGSVYQLPLG